MENKMRTIEQIRAERLKRTEEQLIQLGCLKCSECVSWSHSSYIVNGVCLEHRQEVIKWNYKN